MEQTLLRPKLEESKRIEARDVENRQQVENRPMARPSRTNFLPAVALWRYNAIREWLGRRVPLRPSTNSFGYLQPACRIYLASWLHLAVMTLQ